MGPPPSDCCQASTDDRGGGIAGAIAAERVIPSTGLNPRTISESSPGSRFRCSTYPLPLGLTGGRLEASAHADIAAVLRRAVGAAPGGAGGSDHDTRGRQSLSVASSLRRGRFVTTSPSLMPKLAISVRSWSPSTSSWRTRRDTPAASATRAWPPRPRAPTMRMSRSLLKFGDGPWVSTYIAASSQGDHRWCAA